MAKGRKYIHTSSCTPRRDRVNGVSSEEITLGVYMSDYMKENIRYFCSFMYYDSCLHGHTLMLSAKSCDCPIKKPYIAYHSFTIGHLCSCAENTGEIKIPRWKALEIISDWNRGSAVESREQSRPMRWSYFLPDHDPEPEKINELPKNNFNERIAPFKPHTYEL